MPFERTRALLHVATLALACVLCLTLIGAVGYSLYEVKHRGPEIQAQINAAVAKRVDAETAFLNGQVTGTFKNVNAELDEVHKTTYTANLSVAAVGKVSLQESAMMAELNPKILGTVDNANLFIGQGTTLLAGLQTDTGRITDSTVTAINGLPPVLDGLHTTVTNLNGTILDANTLITGPEIKGTLNQFNGAMYEFHGSMANVNGTTAEIKDYTHKLTHPTILEKTFTYTLQGAGAAAKWFVP